MTNFKRADRVSGEIMRALSGVIRSVKDPRVVPLSITSVSLTSDLRLARVRVVPLGGQGDHEKLLQGLKAASGYLSRQLAKKIKMKYSPKLEFHLDDSLDKAFQLVEELREQESDESESSEEDS